MTGEQAKSPNEMTIQELQEEIGRLQSILHHKVCGDPAMGVSGPVEPAFHRIMRGERG